MEDKKIFAIAQYYTNAQFAGTNLSFKQTAETLHKANADSLAARYGDTIPPITAPRVYTEFPIAPLAVSKLVMTFEYQACEFDAWNTSTPKTTMR